MSKMVVTVSGPRGGTWQQTLGCPIPAAELRGLIAQCNQAEFAVAETGYMSPQMKLLKLICYLCAYFFVVLFLNINYKTGLAYFFGEPQWPLWPAMVFILSLWLSVVIIDVFMGAFDERRKCEKIVLIPKLGIQCETILYTRTLWSIIKSLQFDGDSPTLDQQMRWDGFGGAFSQKRFYPLDRVLDVVINECFKGFQVVFVMQMLIKNDSNEKDYDISLVFPELLPRREFLETVWRSTRELLEEANI